MSAEKTDLPDPACGDDATGCADHQQKSSLVQAALRLFHERGYGKIKFSDIAKEAGITTAEAENCFSSRAEICHQVIEVHLENQALQFDEICQNSNPRQRLSLYLDSFVEKAENQGGGCHIVGDCPVTNLYFDVKREDKELADHAAKLLRQRLGWIRDQFVLMAMAGQSDDLSERLTSAIHGIGILAQATGNVRLIRSQVNQLKSWIRSM